MKACTIIVAGGRGTRMGSDIPKQLLEIGGKTIIERTLHPFLTCPDIDSIVIVTEQTIVSDVHAIIASVRENKKPVLVIAGGKERQDSVLNGIESLPDDCDVVLVHDAVRPFVTPALISTCVSEAACHGAVCVMRPSPETVKLVENGIVTGTPDRSKVWVAQTPQAFRTDILVKAHKHARKHNIAGTDDCMLVERAGLPVHVVPGTDFNIKITSPADLAIAETMLAYIETMEDS